MDGKTCDAHGNSKWITGEESRQDAQRRLRATSQAILVGSGTVKADDPRLTVRFEPFSSEAGGQGPRQPLRVIVTGDPSWLTPGLAIFKDTDASPIMIYTNSGVPLLDWIGKNANVEVLRSESESAPCLEKLLRELGRRGVIQVSQSGKANFTSLAGTGRRRSENGVLIPGCWPDK